MKPQENWSIFEILILSKSLDVVVASLQIITKKFWH